MPPAGFEPTTPASERQQTPALDCAATGIDNFNAYLIKMESIRITKVPLGQAGLYRQAAGIGGDPDVAFVRVRHKSLSNTS